MPKPPARPYNALLREARVALGMTQAQFGAALGSSHRTAIRWEHGRSTPYYGAFAELASLLAPIDLDLAAEAAAAAGETLEALGLAPPKDDKPQAVYSMGDLADAVTCAAADAIDLSPRALRPVLHAAFARARSLGLTVEQLEESLRPRADAKAEKADKRESPRLRVRVEPPATEAPEAEPAPERRSRGKGR